jgi:hypothetical protein
MALVARPQLLAEPGTAAHLFVARNPRMGQQRAALIQHSQG